MRVINPFMSDTTNLLAKMSLPVYDPNIISFNPNPHKNCNKEGKHTYLTLDI